MYCGFDETKVTDTRPADEGTAIRRRRECISCGKRFTTFEKVEMQPIYVVKKDGRREVFDTSKIRSGLVKALEKRPVPLDDIDKVVRDIEMHVYNSLDREIQSSEIGEMVMKKLKDLDEVAFVRFASVYRHFKDINTFMKELNVLLEEKLN